MSAAKKGGRKPRASGKLLIRQINLSVPAYEWIQSQAEELGISAAEFVRRIVDEARLRPKSTGGG